MLIINIFSSKLDTGSMVKTSDYLYLNNEIDFYQTLKMFVPGAEWKLRTK